MSQPAKGKTIFSRLKSSRIRIIIATMAIVAVLASTYTSLSTHNRSNSNVNPPIPIVIDKNSTLRSSGGSLSMLIRVLIRNEGGSGTIIVGARVGYEGVNQNMFEASRLIYIEANQTCDVLLLVSDLLPLPCGARHSVPWYVWTSVP